jgi:group I intron endonuclease
METKPKKQEKFWIYLYTNKVNGMQYVGQTNNPKKRYSEHKSKNKKPQLIDLAIIEFGIENFNFKIIEENIDTRTDANKAETFWVEYLDCRTPKGYNKMKGGFANSHSEDTKRLIGSKSKGRKHRPETIEKMILQRRGVKKGPMSEERKIRMSEARKGISNGPATIEARQKLSKRKQKFTDEQIAEMKRLRFEEHLTFYEIGAIFNTTSSTACKKVNDVSRTNSDTGKEQHVKNDDLWKRVKKNRKQIKFTEDDEFNIVELHSIYSVIELAVMFGCGDKKIYDVLQKAKKSNITS